jgi:hypothetical protein
MPTTDGDVGSRTKHWEENRGTGLVVVIAVDIVKK